MAATRLSGGCQCGAVRFSASAAPGRASLCHCRMCQRAVGGPFAALVEVPTEAVIWERGEPARFASSSIAERGFCAACGTPLFLRDFDGDVTEFMIGALDHPEDVAPAYHYGAESRLPWTRGLDDLAEHRTGEAPGDKPGLAASIVSRQAAAPIAETE